jgi:hypothetical protein
MGVIWSSMWLMKYRIRFCVIYLGGIGWDGCGGRNGCIGGIGYIGYIYWVYCGRSILGGWCMWQELRQCGKHVG